MQPGRDTTLFFCGAIGTSVPCLSPEHGAVEHSEIALKVVTGETGHQPVLIAWIHDMQLDSTPLAVYEQNGSTVEN
jgi:hypothetical protein